MASSKNNCNFEKRDTEVRIWRKATRRNAPNSISCSHWRICFWLTGPAPAVAGFIIEVLLSNVCGNREQNNNHYFTLSRMNEELIAPGVQAYGFLPAMGTTDSTEGNVNPSYDIHAEEWYEKIASKEGAKVLVGVHQTVWCTHSPTPSPYCVTCRKINLLPI